MEFAVYTISVKGLFSKRYEIYKDDELVYRVEKPSFFAFQNMDFTDPGGNILLNLSRQSSIFLFKYKFIITQNGESVATFEKDNMNNFYRSTSLYGNHTIQGDFFHSEYTVFNDEGEIAKVSRKRFRSNKKYGIAIIKGNNELYILAMVIAISIINSRRKRKA